MLRKFHFNEFIEVLKSKLCSFYAICIDGIEFYLVALVDFLFEAAVDFFVNSPAFLVYIICFEPANLDVVFYHAAAGTNY